MHENLGAVKVSQNQRSLHTGKMHSYNTEAWANREDSTEESNVNIPSDFAVDLAKEWVDDGSKL